MILEYCIIKNKHSKDKETIACITTQGETELNRVASETPTYEKAVRILEKYDFIYLEKLWFERYSEEELDSEQLIKELSDIGMVESKSLCYHLQDVMDLNYSSKDSYYTATTTEMVTFDENIPVNARRSPIARKNSLLTYKLPKGEEIITLCFYLFLEAKMDGPQNFYFVFKGDFFSDIGDEFSNFIKPVKLEFKRLEWEEFTKKGKVVFQSVKNFKQLMEDVDIFFSAKYNFASEKILENGKKVKGTFELDHNILEIKDCVQEDAQITFSTTMVDFQQICVISDHIEREIELELQETVSLKIIRETFEDIYKNFNKKRDDAANNEEFEDAAIYRNFSSKLLKKRELIDSIKKKEITIEDYYDMFKIEKF